MRRALPLPALLFFWVCNSLAAEKVVILGNSLSFGHFSSTLKSRLEAGNKNEVLYYAASGGNPLYWLDDEENIPVSQLIHTGDWRRKTGGNAPKFNHLFNEHHPEAIVVQSGHSFFNMLKNKRRTRAQNIAVVRDLVKRTVERIHGKGGIKCFWVLPPESRSSSYAGSKANQEFLEELMMEELGNRCKYYRSLQEIAPPKYGSDGVHYGKAEYIAWANKVADWLLEELPKPRPIALERVDAEEAAARLVELQSEPQNDVQEDNEYGRTLHLRLITKTEPRVPPALANYDYLRGFNHYEEVSTGKIYLVEHFLFEQRVKSPAYDFVVGQEFLITLKKLPEVYKGFHVTDTIDDFERIPYFSDEMVLVEGSQED